MNDQKLQVNIGFRNPQQDVSDFESFRSYSPWGVGYSLSIILIAYLSGALLKMGLADGISKSGAFEFRSTK